MPRMHEWPRPLPVAIGKLGRYFRTSSLAGIDQNISSFSWLLAVGTANILLAIVAISYDLSASNSNLLMYPLLTVILFYLQILTPN